MNIDIIKQVICNAIPSNVNISDIDIKEGNGKLIVQISWEVLKATESDNSHFNSSCWARADHVPNFNQTFGFSDGYCGYLGLHQEMPSIGPLSVTYMAGLKAEFEKQEEEANKDSFIMKKLDEAYEALNNCKKKSPIMIKAQPERGIDDLQQGSRFEAELKLLPLCRKLIVDYPENVKQYRAGKDGQLGFLLGKFITNPDNRILDSKFLDIGLIGEVLERLLNESQDPIKGLASQIIAAANHGTKGNEQYAKVLIRAGVDPINAARMSGTETPIPKIKLGPQRIVTQVDLEESEIKAKKRNSEISGCFRRSELDNDGYQVPISTLAKAQKIDNLLQKGIIKKEDVDSLVNCGFDSETVSFFKERYEFPENYHTNWDIKNDYTSHTEKCKNEFQHSCDLYKKYFGDTDLITDTEVMLLTNKGFINNIINEYKPLVESLDKETSVKETENKEEPISVTVDRPATKLNKILFHLRSIKQEIFGK